jgi:ABC-type multidrug transport system ATPase subunit
MITVEDVCAGYGKNRILDNACLTAECGDRIAITGMNGSGKSTFLQVMAGVLKPVSGRITYFGEDVTRQRKLFSKYCGYVPQSNPLLEELTVLDNLRLWNKGDKNIEPAVLNMNGLGDILGQKVSTLSGGMKRRLSIACAMQGIPPVMLLDEPTASLDMYYKGQVWDWMNQYQAGNGIIIIISHEREEIDSCNKQYEIKDRKMFLVREE